MVTTKKNKEKEEKKKRERKSKVEVKGSEKSEKEGKKRRRIAVVRVRGKVHVRGEIEDTLKMLNLTRVNHCVVIDSRKEYMGMINKVNDYVTWGEISQEVMEKLIKGRGCFLKGGENKKILDDDKSIKDFVKNFMNFNLELKDINLKPVFRLNPPKKGYDRKGIKKPFSKGGALGYRGEKINELIERMI
jgi:large subunit ribosomal protein L30